MSFFRHEEIYRPMSGSTGGLATAPSLHRYDEFPASYSSASCSPALLASASPAVGSMIGFTSAGNALPANSHLSLISVFHPRGAVQSVPHYPSHITPHCLRQGRGSGGPDLRLRAAFARIRVNLFLVLPLAPFHLVVRDGEYLIHEFREALVLG
jgi:hypothetical protein